MFQPSAKLPVEELRRLFWLQRVEKFERERTAWTGSEGQRELEAIEADIWRCRQKLYGHPAAAADAHQEARLRLMDITATLQLIADLGTPEDLLLEANRKAYHINRGSHTNQRYPYSSVGNSRATKDC